MPRNPVAPNPVLDCYSKQEGSTQHRVLGSRPDHRLSFVKPSQLIGRKQEREAEKCLYAGHAIHREKAVQGELRLQLPSAKMKNDGQRFYSLSARVQLFADIKFTPKSGECHVGGCHDACRGCFSSLSGCVRVEVQTFQKCARR